MYVGKKDDDARILLLLRRSRCKWDREQTDIVNYVKK